jgi:hypothetical protein
MTTTPQKFPLRAVASLRRFAYAVFALALLPLASAVTYNVSTSAQFVSALSSVQPGDTILLSGTITGGTFVTSRAGTAASPITIRGDGTARISGTPYALEIMHNYYQLDNFILQNSPKGLVIDNASHGTVDNVHVMDVQQEAFKIRNQSQYWEFTFCSARRTGLSGDFGEGFYTGQASSNWINGVPDASGFVTFFNCYTLDTVNDGWDTKEGAHDIKMVNCTADFSGAVEPVTNAAHGSAGFYIRSDRVQMIKCRVNGLGNGDWGYRISNQTVNSIDYGSTGNEVKQSSVTGGNVPLIFSESGTNAKVYTDCVTGPGGFYNSGSAVVATPAPSTFAERTWSGEGGGTWGDLDSTVGAMGDPLGSPPPAQVAAPTFNPGGGAYTSAQSVTIATATSGASIRYTTNGTAPTSTTGTLYSGPVSIAATTTLKAIAYKSGSTDSSVTSATYTINAATVAAPTFSPAGGTYSTAQSVTISTTTTGASIRYTTDGSTPTSTTGTLYSSQVSISATTTLKAIAFKSGSTDSSVTSATYTISATAVAAPVFNPAGGTYTSAQSVTITSSTTGASIRYTTNGTSPTATTGTLYSAPVSISATTTLKAIAYKSGSTDSSVTSATYTINTGGGSGSQSITITVSSDDAKERTDTTSGTMNLTSSLPFGNAGSTYTIGVRFPGATIPAGAVITSATIQFTAHAASSVATSLTVKGQKSTNAATFTTTGHDITSRPATTASVAWSPSAWADAERAAPEKTPELKTIVQEIVNQAGWASGSPLVFTISGTGDRSAEAMDNGAGKAATLTLTWQ